MRSRRNKRSTFDARMLGVANALFEEFDDLPVMTVIQALNSARAELREPGRVGEPERIAGRARELLQAGRDRTVVLPRPAGEPAAIRLNGVVLGSLPFVAAGAGLLGG